MDKEIKLNLGCGHNKLEGYINVDIRKTPAADIVCSILELNTTFNNVDSIYARHVLEHFNFTECDKVLEQIYKTLKTGGEFNVIVPDLEFHFKQLTDVQKMFKVSPLDYNGVVNLEHAICSIYGWQKHEQDFHYNGFTQYTLTRKLQEFSFKDIVRNTEDKPWNLNIMCHK